MRAGFKTCFSNAVSDAAAPSNKELPEASRAFNVYFFALIMMRGNQNDKA